MNARMPCRENELTQLNFKSAFAAFKQVSKPHALVALVVKCVLALTKVVPFWLAVMGMRMNGWQAVAEVVEMGMI